MMIRMFSPSMVIGCLMISSLAATATELPPPAPASTNAFAGPWGGIYGGYGWADPSGEFTMTGGAISPYPVVVDRIDAAGKSTIAAAGAVFGLQGGWNWRTDSNFVVGLEGDVGRYGLLGKYATGGTVPLYDIPFTINQSYSAGWEAATRLRAGYAFNNFALAFVEAGPAIADLHYKTSYWDAGDETEYRAFEAVKLGVSLGAGVEFAITHNLTVSAEYVYSRFPSLSGSGTAVLTTGTTPDGTYESVYHSSGDLNQNVFRIGLNYYLY
jgi:outer membrane immunogenic protein